MLDATATELLEHELSCRLARAGIRRQHPGADDAEVERQLRKLDGDPTQTAAQA